MKTYSPYIQQAAKQMYFALTEKKTHHFWDMMPKSYREYYYQHAYYVLYDLEALKGPLTEVYYAAAERLLQSIGHSDTLKLSEEAINTQAYYLTAATVAVKEYLKALVEP